MTHPTTDEEADVLEVQLVTILITWETVNSFSFFSYAHVGISFLSFPYFFWGKTVISFTFCLFWYVLPVLSLFVFLLGLLFYEHGIGMIFICLSSEHGIGMICYCVYML